MNDTDTDHQRDLERWFALSCDLTDESLFDYAISTFDRVQRLGNSPLRGGTVVRFAEEALEAVARKLPICPAKSPAQLRRWCRQQIDKHANKLTAKTAEEKHIRKDTKPFRYEQHGDVCFVEVPGDDHRHIWSMPADWLDQARLLWPVYIRYGRTGPYLARKEPVLMPDGTKRQRERAIHHLFLGCADGEAVGARDGDLLNFVGGNLYLLRSSDLMDRAVSLTPLEWTITSDWKPARSTMPPRANDPHADVAPFDPAS